MVAAGRGEFEIEENGAIAAGRGEFEIEENGTIAAGRKCPYHFFPFTVPFF